MFGTMSFLKNLLFCVLVGQVTAERITETEARMFDLFNGNYENSAQVARSNSSYDFVQAVLCPVIVEAISSKPLIYCFEVVNGVIKLAYLYSIEETRPGIIAMETYSVTRPSLSKEPPYFFNRTEIENLKLEEIEHVVGCRTEIEFHSNYFVGRWDDYDDTKQGNCVIYGMTILCDKISFITPAAAQEKSSLAPYDLVLVSDRYPLINAPENYTCFCDKQNAEVNQ